MKEWAGFSYRSFNIHVGALLGTNMAFNVWFRIWPAQQQIIAQPLKMETLLMVAWLR